jgi:hypothetical protein
MFFKGFWGIIGKQITLCFFLKDLATEVSGLGDTVVLTTLQNYHMSIWITMITLQYGFALITHHYVPLLPTRVDACCCQRFSDTMFPQPGEVVADLISPYLHAIIAALVLLRHVRTIKK